MTDTMRKRLELENRILEIIDLVESGEVTRSDAQGMVEALAMDTINENRCHGLCCADFTIKKNILAAV
jgi:hypothetical protein